MPRLLIQIFCLLGAATLAVAADSPLKESRQCLIVQTDDWTAKRGQLTSFSRDSVDGPWISRGDTHDVVVGLAGLAWGRGLADLSGQKGPVKRERDRKAPAGVFRLGQAFGYAAVGAESVRQLKLPYLALTPDFEGVDDPRSRFYNRIVERSKVDAVDWKTAERMRRKDSLYKWGVVVECNTDPVEPGAGSCIFLHIWRNAESGTAGCTAMTEENLIRLLGWLDPKEKPVLIQLPREVYGVLRSEWKLP